MKAKGLLWLIVFLLVVAAIVCRYSDVGAKGFCDKHPEQCTTVTQQQHQCDQFTEKKDTYHGEGWVTPDCDPPSDPPTEQPANPPTISSNTVWVIYLPVIYNHPRKEVIR